MTNQREEEQASAQSDAADDPPTFDVPDDAEPITPVLLEELMEE